MSKPLIAWHAVATVTIIALVAWWTTRFISGETSEVYPNRPIHVVVPYAAGGGSDTFVRIMQKGIVEDNLLPQPLVIINQPGGIGTIGSREVKNAKPDGYKILCHHNAIITARLTETVSYGPEAFEPIALTGEMSMVIMVRDDSPVQNIVDLLEQAKARPKEVRFGANKGAPAYFTTLQLEQAWPGADFSIVSAGGGADRYSKILGGHLDAGIFSLSEYLDFRGVEGTPPEQNVRAIALISAQRHESIPDVPTTVEMGIPVVLSNANYWWAPRGTPKPILETLARVLREAMQNESVRSELQRLRIDPTFDQGESFERRLDETIARFEAAVAQKPATVPNFTIYVVVIVGLLLVFVMIESWRSSDAGESDTPLLRDDFVTRPGIAAAAFVLLAVYVALLGTGWLPFAWLSAVMVATIGAIMIPGTHGHATRTRWSVLLELALITGLGAQFIFTEVFATTLP